jgi:hypothetical protein
MTWNKKHVERVPAGYAEKFPEDLGDCLVCGKPHSGIYMSMVNLARNDSRVLAPLRGIVDAAMFAFSICGDCYELPDIEKRVVAKLSEGHVEAEVYLPTKGKGWHRGSMSLDDAPSDVRRLLMEGGPIIYNQLREDLPNVCEVCAKPATGTGMLCCPDSSEAGGFIIVWEFCADHEAQDPKTNEILSQHFAERSAQ